MKRQDRIESIYNFPYQTVEPLIIPNSQNILAPLIGEQLACKLLSAN